MRTVSAEHNQTFQTEFLVIAFDAFHRAGRAVAFLPVFVFERLFAGSPEKCSAQRQDAGQIPGRQLPCTAFDQTPVAVFKSDCLHAVYIDGGSGNCTDGRVQTGRVSARS